MNWLSSCRDYRGVDNIANNVRKDTETQGRTINQSMSKESRMGGNMLAVQAGSPERDLKPKQPILSMMVHSDNPSSGEAEAGKSLVLTGQLA